VSGGPVDVRINSLSITLARRQCTCGRLGPRLCVHRGAITRDHPKHNRYTQGCQVTDVYPTVFEQAGGIILGWLNGVAWQARRACHPCCRCHTCTEVMIALIADLGRLQRPPHIPVQVVS
jgi:hypothetical protein